MHQEEIARDRSPTHNSCQIVEEKESVQRNIYQYILLNAQNIGELLDSLDVPKAHSTSGRQGSNDRVLTCVHEILESSPWQIPRFVTKL
jgi:hypothetical protein